MTLKRLLAQGETRQLGPPYLYGWLRVTVRMGKNRRFSYSAHTAANRHPTVHFKDPPP